LARILANEGADISAHETLRRAQHAAESWTTVHSEYQTLAAAAQADRWDELISRSGLMPEAQALIRRSPAQGALHAALREAEACELDVDRFFPLLARGCLDDANDPAAVLEARVRRWTAAIDSHAIGTNHLIAGLVPRATGVQDPDMTRALVEREQSMVQRARHLAEQAVASRQVWVGKLGQAPADPLSRRAWMAALTTIAAYRERWSIGSDPLPLGSHNVHSLEQLTHMRRAQTAVEVAIALVRHDRSFRQDPSGFEVSSARRPVLQGPCL
jgi:hypothetical protein